MLVLLRSTRLCVVRMKEGIVNGSGAPSFTRVNGMTHEENRVICDRRSFIHYKCSSSSCQLLWQSLVENSLLCGGKRELSLIFSEFRSVQWVAFASTATVFAEVLDKCGTWTLAAASENNYTLVIYFCSYLYISFVNSEITLGNCIMPFYGHLPVKNSLFGFLLRSVGQ